MRCQGRLIRLASKRYRATTSHLASKRKRSSHLHKLLSGTQCLLVNRRIHLSGTFRARDRKVRTLTGRIRPNPKSERKSGWRGSEPSKAASLLVVSDLRCGHNCFSAPVEHPKIQDQSPLLPQNTYPPHRLGGLSSRPSTPFT